jgi:hypothetical protein
MLEEALLNSSFDVDSLIKSSKSETFVESKVQYQASKQCLITGEHPIRS